MRKRSIRNRTNLISGRPATSQRQLLFRLIRDAKGHIDAKELYHRAIKEDQPISLATVYRNLRFFKEIGLIDERRLGHLRSYYEITRSAGHQHLLCLGCNRLVEFDSPLIHELVDKLQHEQKFEVTKTELYLEGCCPRCGGK